MKQFLILTLFIAIIGSAWGQCTITQPTLLNPHLSNGVVTFDLQFKHNRNNGNKWVTIHFWTASAYPSYDYDRAPTTNRLGGISKRPFGSIVINNTTVSSSGTYTADQAFADGYQNDEYFQMMDVATTTLVYNSATDVYILKGLHMKLPTGTTVIRFDSWSSQSNDNNNVHCYSLCGSIPVPGTLGVDGLTTFKAEIEDGEVKFTWTTHWETNNSHFLIQEYKDSMWVDRGMILSKYEDGNCSHDTQYQYTIETRPAAHSAGYGIGVLVLVLALVCRRFIPARLTLLVAGAIAMGSIACNSSKHEIIDTLQSAHTYRLLQVDLDGKISDSPQRIVKF
jgi:hypothetical protein